jgi:hypothetical protein
MPERFATTPTVDDEVSIMDKLSMMAPMTPGGVGLDQRQTMPAASPPAERPRRSRWRDPRLVVGIALVALCAVLGARFVGGSSSDTVAVWAARRSMPEGRPVGPDNVVRRDVRFADQSDADRYLSADADLPQGATLGRAVGAGELLPRAALASAGTATVTEVPLSVDTEAVPATIGVGSVVDVWVTPDKSADALGRSTLVFDDVSVISVQRSTTTLGPTATRQVIVGVGEDQERRLPRSIAALSSGSIVLTARR